MSSNPQNKYIDAELDPEWLTTPFRVQTKWHVITGSSCSGKTTLIQQLAEQGFQTVPEAGRQFFKRELAKGRTIEEIREDPVSYTSQVYDIMIQNEAALNTNEVFFLDRGIPDSFAFFRLAGIDPNDVFPDCFQHHYDSVFMLHRFPYEKDGVRVADDDTADYLETWMVRDYTALGYNLIWVPVLPPAERLTFVLEKLSG